MTETLDIEEYAATMATYLEGNPGSTYSQIKKRFASDIADRALNLLIARGIVLKREERVELPRSTAHIVEIRYYAKE